VADGRASLATQAARGTPLQRSPHGAGRDHVGGANGLLLARDTGRVRQVGECLPRHYELWLRQGLWQRILEALGEEALPGPATK
jgi:hypothetical protein